MDGTFNSKTIYKDEIIIFNNRLSEVASKNNSKDVLSEIEKFQNQFIIQNNTIDQIKHIINLDEDKIKKELNLHSGAIDIKKVESHPGERDLVDTFEKNFNLLRADFNKFIGKWM